MAFTGSPTIKKISANRVRITGLSLAAGASGTIGLEAGAGEVDVVMPEWQPYETSGTHGGDVGLNEAIEVDVVSADAAGTATEDIAVVKAGATEALFLATLTNKDAAASGALEIYLNFAI